jgi:hypothetical protein
MGFREDVLVPEISVRIAALQLNLNRVSTHSRYPSHGKGIGCCVDLETAYGVPRFPTAPAAG